MTNNGNFTYGQSTDTGMLRSINQDCILSKCFPAQADQQPELGLFVVADGMGGHQHGEKASALAAEIIVSEFTRLFEKENTPILEALTDAVQKANGAIIASLPNSGTVVTAAALVGSLAHIVHVGDTRAYIITSTDLEQITKDHSLVQRLVDMGQMLPDDARRHRIDNVLYRALGQDDVVEIDTIKRRLPADSRLLLCSDGLWKMLSKDEIITTANSDSDPDAACERLIEMANERGGEDNIAAILVRVH